jgi:hypothetical protein
MNDLLSIDRFVICREGRRKSDGLPGISSFVLDEDNGRRILAGKYFLLFFGRAP